MAALLVLLLPALPAFGAAFSAGGFSAAGFFAAGLLALVAAFGSMASSVAAAFGFLAAAGLAAAFVVEVLEIGVLGLVVSLPFLV